MIPKLKYPWKRLSDEEVRKIMEGFCREDIFKDKPGGILKCLCGGTGMMPMIGGKPVPCPYCSPKIG